MRGEGATLIPGLIEMHTHPMTPAFGNRFGRAHLAYGVTSVRVPAAAAYRVLEERESILAGLRVGPRVFLTGAPLDGTRIYYAGAPALSSGQAMDAALELARDLDYDVVKTYVRLDDETQREAIRRAQRMGAFVTSHELYPAVRYGVNGLEHVKGTSRRGFSAEDDRSGPCIPGCPGSDCGIRGLLHSDHAHLRRLGPGAHPGAGPALLRPADRGVSCVACLFPHQRARRGRRSRGASRAQYGPHAPDVGHGQLHRCRRWPHHRRNGYADHPPTGSDSSSKWSSWRRLDSVPPAHYARPP